MEFNDEELKQLKETMEKVGIDNIEHLCQFLRDTSGIYVDTNCKWLKYMECGVDTLYFETDKNCEIVNYQKENSPYSPDKRLTFTFKQKEN